jgi:hypothetical protein
MRVQGMDMHEGERVRCRSPARWDLGRHAMLISSELELPSLDIDQRFHSIHSIPFSCLRITKGSTLGSSSGSISVSPSEM